jgi:hypothetical protein
MWRTDERLFVTTALVMALVAAAIVPECHSISTSAPHQDMHAIARSMAVHGVVPIGSLLQAAHPLWVGGLHFF